MSIVWAASNIPRTDKVADGGDDAWFISDSTDSAGVSDGVGRWRAKGINAGKFARMLMVRCKKSMEAHKNSANPYMALKEAYAKKGKVLGSATALVVRGFDNKLYACQVGDSTLVIIRNGRCVYASDPQEHIFDIPYQLGNNNETPKDGWRYVIPIQDGDTIVVGSDGLFNNLYVRQMASIINNFPMDSSKDNMQIIADKLSQEAFNKSLSSAFWSPYAQRGYEQGVVTAFDLKYMGGHPDDITCVVGRVKGVGMLDE